MLRTRMLALIILFMTIIGSLRSDAKLETWLDLDFSYDFNPKTNLYINNEWETLDGLRQFYWYHLDAFLTKDIGNNFTFGGHFRYVRRDNGSTWVHEARPGLLIKYSFDVASVPFFTRIMLDHRAVDKEKDRTMLHWQVGTYLTKTKYASFYITEELFYNYYGNKQIDTNYLILGLNGPITSSTDWGFYFSHYNFKPQKNGGWGSSNALGIVFNAKF